MSAPTTTLDAEALLVHGPFLRALARSLLGDAARAEDVVQQTYLTALEKPPRQAASLRAWMATVTRNLAREGGRREGRRKGWERNAARSEALPSTEDIVQREAIRRQVVEAVVELEPLYRDVILLRFYEDLPPRRIARELGLPVETVRTRIKRGLARLEASLDGRHGGDRKRWLAALAPLALTRQASAGVGGWLVQSLSSLGTTSQAALAVLTLATAATLTYLWLEDQEPATPAGSQGLTSDRDDGAANADGALAAGAAGLTSGASNTDGDGDLTLGGGPAEPLAPLETPALTGRLLAADGTPVAHGEVLVVGAAFDDPADLARAGRDELQRAWVERRVPTDAEGRYRLGGLQTGVWVVAVPGTAEQPFLAGGAVLVGIPPVLSLIADHQVRQRCEEAGLEPVAFHSLDAEGTATLDLVGRDVPDRPLIVLDERGRPIPGAEITVASPDARLALEAGPYRSLVWPRLEPFLPVLTAGDDGRLAAPLQRDGLLVARAPGHAPAVVLLDEAALMTPRLELVLPSTLATTIHGLVQDDEGDPVPGARVQLDEYGFGGTLPLLEGRVEDRTLRHVVVADEQGRFHFDDVRQLSDDPWDAVPLTTGSRLMVVAGAEGFLNDAEQVSPGGGAEASEVRLTLVPGGPFEVTLIDQTTLEPLTGVDVGISYENEAGGRNSSYAAPDADGLRSQGDVPHGPVSLEVLRLGHEPFVHQLTDWRGEPVDLLVELAPVDWLLEVSLSDGAGTLLDGPTVDHGQGPSDAAVRHRVVAFDHDPRGRLADGFRGGLDARDAQLGQQVEGLWQDGRLVLPLGQDFDADQAWVGVLRYGRLLAVERVVRGQTRLQLVAPGLEPGAALGLLSVQADGDDSEVYLVATDVLDAASGDLVTRLDSTWTRPTMEGLVPAGTYDLVLVGLTGFRQVVPGVRVAAGGAPTVVEVPLAQPASLELSILGADGQPAEGQVLIHDQAGRALARRSLSGGVTRFARLSPGARRVTVLGRAGQASVALELQPGEQARHEVRLQDAALLELSCELEGALVIVRDAEGRGLIETLMAVGDRQTLSLASGAYEVCVAARDGRVSRQVLTLSDETASLVLR